MNISSRGMIAPCAGAIVMMTVFCAKSPTKPDTKIYRSKITGKVEDRRGNGLSGVSITSSPGGYTTVSLSTGVFELPDLEAGSYSLNFHYVDFLDTATDTIIVGLGQTRSMDENMKLTFRFGTIRGTVYDMDNTPQFGAGVAIEDQYASTQTSPGGKFLLPRIDPGRIVIYAAVQGKGYGIDTIENVAADDTLSNIAIILTRNGGTVSGTVVNELRQPVAGAVVSALSGVLNDTTGADGVFKLTGVPSGVALVLTITAGTGEIMLSGIVVEERDTIHVDSVYVRPLAIVNDISIMAADAIVTSTQPEVVLLAQTSVSGTAIIDHFAWDTDNNGSFEIETATGRLAVPTGLTGSRQVKVKAVSTTGLESSVITLTIMVTGPALPDTINIQPPVRP